MLCTCRYHYLEVSSSAGSALKAQVWCSVWWLWHELQLKVIYVAETRRLSVTLVRASFLVAAALLRGLHHLLCFSSSLTEKLQTTTLQWLWHEFRIKNVYESYNIRASYKTWIWYFVAAAQWLGDDLHKLIDLYHSSPLQLKMTNIIKLESLNQRNSLNLFGIQMVQVPEPKLK